MDGATERFSAVALFTPWNIPAILGAWGSAPLFTLPALRRARDLIDREYAMPLNLDALAREAGYSRYHFARAFAAAYGEPPRAYLSRRRIERAKSLLRWANLTVTEVCLLVGFESLGSFSALFKRLVGQSPSEYQRQLPHAGGPPPIPGCVVMMWTRPHPQATHSPKSEASGALNT
jgi:AraC-like DNA-binding protein